MTDLKAVAIMLRATHALEGILKKDIESYEINTTEFGVLEYLYHKGKQPMANIGKKLLMANSSMTYVIDQLYKKKHVDRLKNPNDKREITIDITSSGKEFFESIFEHHKKTVKKVFDILNTEELVTLTTLLKKVGYYSEELLNKGDI
jgi:MarR family 2-MHQ and catechol resistance regulon transcriptional repressor